MKGLSGFDIKPQQLGMKASNLQTLKQEIEKAIQAGYDEVFCLIDMDSKGTAKSKQEYSMLKSKYHQKVFEKKREGTACRVRFIETERCTELWFLYHFTPSALTKKFTSYKELENELRIYRPDYEKTIKYFRKNTNFHQTLTTGGLPHGSLKQAMSNAASSQKSRIKDGRDYSYSEMNILIEALEIEDL